MPALPGSDAAEVAKLYAAIRDHRDRLDRLERAQTVSAQEATVTVGLVGTTCQITTDGGTTRYVRPLVGFTPIVGRRVLVLDTQWGGVVIGEPAH